MTQHGRLLAIGDIHGHIRAFRQLLNAIQLSPDDRLILLGDYVESGEDSAGVLDCVQSLLSRGNVHALLGNQEAICAMHWPANLLFQSGRTDRDVRPFCLMP